MLITRRTRTRDVLPFVTDKETMDRIIGAVDEVPLDKPLIEMTIAEFAETTDEDYVLRFLNEKYAWKAFGKLKSLKKQTEEITKFLQMNEVKPNKDQESAAIGVVFPDMVEQMLIRVTEFFHLKSFDEAEQVKLSNYMLINKKDSSEAKFRSNYEKIIEMKNKQRNGRRGR